MRKVLVIILLTYGLIYSQLYVGFSGFGKVHYASLQGINDVMDFPGVSVNVSNVVRGAGGLAIELGINQYFGFQSGVWYVAEGGKAEVSYAGQTKTDEYFYNFNAIKIPFYIRVGEGMASQKVYFSAYMGPQFAFAGSRTVSVNGTEYNSDTLMSSFKTSYVEISGRIQIDVPLSKYSSLSFALGGDYSVTNIYSPIVQGANDATVNPLNFGFYFGFTRIIALKTLRKVWF